MTTQSPHLCSRQLRRALPARTGTETRTGTAARTGTTATRPTVRTAAASETGAPDTAVVASAAKPVAGKAVAGKAVVGKPAGVQTRLPWWAVALPAVAFAALLALLSGGTAHADTAASGADLFGRMVTALADLVHHLP